MPQDPTIRLDTFTACRNAYRHRDLRQALYDEGAALMSDVIVNLHGNAHRDRRRLENRLFRPDVFLDWEGDLIPRTVRKVLEPALDARRGDLVALARRSMMIIATGIAGVDRRDGTDEELDQLFDIMSRLSRASVVVHATGDKRAIVADGLVALGEFDSVFLSASIARRRDLMESGETPPDDVLSILMANADSLDLPHEVLLREVAYYPWVGSHSTSNALAHAFDHMMEWSDRNPHERGRLSDDLRMVQRFVHESLRLHPPSPEALRVATVDVELPGGTFIPEGTSVVLDLIAANRDPAVFGSTAAAFDPERVLPAGVNPWGLAFGSGYHSCLGQELAGGITGSDASTPPMFGAVAVMAHILLAAGARRDQDDPPQADSESRRPQFSRYPLLFS